MHPGRKAFNCPGQSVLPAEGAAGGGPDIRDYVVKPDPEKRGTVPC